MRHLLTIAGGRKSLWVFLFLLTLMPISGDQPDDMADSFYFPFIVNSRERGDIEIGLDASFEPKYLNTAEMIDYLSDIVRKEYIERLEADPWLTFQQLRRSGLPVEYLERELAVSLKIPAEAAVPVTNSLERPPPRRFGEELEAADFSFFTNIYTNISYRNMFVDDSLRIDSIVFEPNLNYHGWVMESRGRFTHSDEDGLTLSDTRHARIIRYSDDTRTRFVLGDLISRDISFSGGGTWGILLERNRSFGFTPRWNTNYELVHMLSDPANVQLKVNDREQFSKNLGQGEYTFRDFSLTPGVNEIKLIKERENGEKQTITEQIPFDRALIPKGTSEFAFGAGFPSFQKGIHDPQDYFRIFGYVTGGLSHQLTANYYYDLGYHDQLHGIRFALATLYGNFLWNSKVILGPGKDIIEDFSSSLTYQYYDRAADRTFGFDAVLDTREKQDEEDETISLSELSLTFNYSQSLFPTLHFHSSFGLAYDWEEDPGEHITTSAVSGLRHRFRINRNTSLYTTASVNWTEGTLRASAFVSTSFADNRVTASARQAMDLDPEREDRIEHSTSLSATYRPDRMSPFGPVNLTASNFDYARGLPKNIQVSGSYTNPYFSSSFQQALRFKDDDKPSANFSLRLNTAFAYADGVFTVTRPISNSFILVKPGIALEDTKLGINPGGGGYAAQTNIFNTAVLSNVPSFRTTSLFLEPIDPPDDLYFSENQFQFTTRYKQTAVLRPGAEYRVMLTGRIFLEQDKPLAYAAGDIRPDDYEDEDDLNYFFTDERGRLFAYDLSAGEYLMTIYMRDRVERLMIVIPEEIRGTATLGDIYLDEEAPSPEPEERKVSLTGRLLYFDGLPAEFVFGELKQDQRSYIFTSGYNGWFNIDGVVPGTYELHLAETEEVIEVHIPEDIPERATLGIIYIMYQDMDEEAYDAIDASLEMYSFRSPGFDSLLPGSLFTSQTRM